MSGPSSPPGDGRALKVVVRRRKTVSAAQLEANRRNALRSTGPRTPEGKARSAANPRKSTGPRTPEGKARTARNALKHGVWASTAIHGAERLQLLSRLRRLISEEALSTPVEVAWGLAFSYAQWLQERLERQRATLEASADHGHAYGPFGPFDTADLRLGDRLVTLIRWRIKGLDAARVAGHPFVAGGLAALGDLQSAARIREFLEPHHLVAAATDVVERTEAIGAGEGLLSERTEAIGAGEGLLSERTEAIGAGEELLSERTEAIGAGEELLLDRTEAIGAGAGLLSERTEAIGAGEGLLSERTEAIGAGEKILSEQTEAIGAGNGSSADQANAAGAAGR